MLGCGFFNFGRFGGCSGCCGGSGGGCGGGGGFGPATWKGWIAACFRTWFTFIS